MAKPPVKEPMNAVHQNAILCETIRKETRNQELFRNYGVNPFKKVHTLSGKPNSFHDSEDGDEDPQFLAVFRRAHQEPGKKYTKPQTEAQEIGWITRPLLETDKADRRLHFPRQNTAITKYMEAAWQIKEQSDNLS